MQLTYQKLKPFALSYLTAPLAVFLRGISARRLPLRAWPCWPLPGGMPCAKRRRLSKWGKRAGHYAFGAKAGAAVCPDAVVGLPGRSDGLFYQNSDWGYRNAIYRDLITNSWPVYYPQKDTALVYYIGHWLVPAALTKPVYALFGLDAAWMFARMALWGWTALGTYLVALNLLVYLRADTGKSRGSACCFDFLQRHGYSGRAVQQPPAGPAGL